MYTVISDKAVASVMQDGRIKSKVFERLRERFRLKTNDTPRTYFKEKDDLLTTPDAVRIISEETGLTPQEILAEVETLS